VRVIAKSALTRFAERNPRTTASLTHWHTVARAASWRNCQEVVASFSKAKTINSERVRFEVAGGDYRMIVAFDERQVAFVKFIGTHGAYDQSDAATASLF
jgi:mRNA interferase HigB